MEAGLFLTLVERDNIRLTSYLITLSNDCG